MPSIDHPTSGPGQRIAGTPSVESPAAIDPVTARPAEPAPAAALDQPFDADALFSLRSAVAAHASDLGAGDAVNDTVLVAHELSSNAVRHGGGSGRLRLWRVDDRLYCEVSDSGEGMTDPFRTGTSRPSPSVPGGRGLWIARQLAEIHIYTRPDGTTVTAVLPLPGDAF